MEGIRDLLIWILILKVVSSRHLVTQQDVDLKQSKNDVEQETNLEFQLGQLLRQLSPPDGAKFKPTDLADDNFEEDSYEDDGNMERTKDAIRPLPLGQTLEDDPSSPEVVYGKLVYYPSSVSVDPTHRSSTEVESAILSRFRPPVVSQQRKDTTTISPKKGESSKKRRKNERKAAKEERMLENLIQLAEKYGTETKLGDMLKKLCNNSTVSCKGFDPSKEVDQPKKNRKKQNQVSKQQQSSRKNGRKPKNSRNAKNQNSLTTDRPERRRNKQNRKSKSSRRNKNTRANEIAPADQTNVVTTGQRDLSSGIDKPESKKRRRLSGIGVLPTTEPSDNLEKELIDLENGNGKAENRVSKRMKKHRAMKNDTRDRLQKHIQEQIDLHQRIQHELLK